MESNHVNNQKGVEALCLTMCLRFSERAKRRFQENFEFTFRPRSRKSE